MKSCKDVQMGAPSWHVLVTQRLCSGWRPPSPAVSPNQRARALGMGQETVWSPAPQLTCLDTPPFHLHFMSCARLRTKLQKVLGKTEAPAFSKEEISVFLLVDCLLFIFAPLSLRSHSRGCRGPRALGPSWVSVLPSPGTGTHPGPMGFLTKPHPHILQSLS